LKLVYESSGKEVQIGDTAVTRKGTTVTVISFRPPQHAGSSGKVLVKDGNLMMEYYPSVIGARFIE
jgi:hypothetical protein